MKKEQNPRHRRLDLINSLPNGSQKYIAKVCGCSRGNVSAVLNGYRSQSNDLGTNIVRLAERMAQDAHRRNRKNDLR